MPNMTALSASVNTTASETDTGIVVRHNSRPLAPAKRRALELTKTITSSKPVLDFINNGSAGGTEVACWALRGGATHNATPLAASSAYVTPEALTATISDCE